MSLIGTIIEFTYIGGTPIDKETYTNTGTIFDNYNENQYLVAKEMLYGPIMYLILQIPLPYRQELLPTIIGTLVMIVLAIKRILVVKRIQKIVVIKYS